MYDGGQINLISYNHMTDIYLSSRVRLLHSWTGLWIFQFCCNPFPIDNILDWSKLKELAGNNLKFDENGGKFSKRMENTGEIARYKQLLLFLQCLQKTFTADMLKTRACLGKG